MLKNEVEFYQVTLFGGFEAPGISLNNLSRYLSRFYNSRNPIASTVCLLKLQSHRPSTIPSDSNLAQSLKNIIGSRFLKGFSRMRFDDSDYGGTGRFTGLDTCRCVFENDDFLRRVFDTQHLASHQVTFWGRFAVFDQIGGYENFRNGDVEDF
jgi:hypothetical protein